MQGMVTQLKEGREVSMIAAPNAMQPRLVHISHTDAIRGPMKHACAGHTAEASS